MQEEVVLLTGAGGEIGNSLIEELSKTIPLVGLDINQINEDKKNKLKEFVQADILDREVLNQIFEKYKVVEIFHLASILSTAAEKMPEKAHFVNVDGTFNLLELTHEFSQKYQHPIKFIFPSTIAVYGITDNTVTEKNYKVKESEFNNPITMYGINKLYCENLGIYFLENYKMLDDTKKLNIDFRALRFPGIISAMTTPTGGTSDYAPEMLHSAAQGQGYESFVTPNAVLPFIVMPDAVRALIEFSNTPTDKLTQRVYNVGGFSATAQELAEVVNKAFPDSAISYAPDTKRQRIVDSWPADVDDSAAQLDWGWKPEYDLQKGFEDYLIPAIKEKYY